MDRVLKIKWACSKNRSHQPCVSELINIFAPNGTGVEIGVNEGQLSHYLLQNTTIQHLYLVDPWITWKRWASQGELENRYDFCNKTLPKLFSNRCSTVRKTSSKAHVDIPDNLDFIFIDGNHDYEFVKQDLELWVPKIKPGGLVAGHDWSARFTGVVKAVREYFEKYKNEILSPITDYSQVGLKLRHQPAPGVDSIVNRSKTGNVWWTIKKENDGIEKAKEENCE